MLGTGRFDGAWVPFDLERGSDKGLGNRTGTNPDVFDDQVLQDQCIAGGADTKSFGGQVEGKSDRLGPLCARITEGDNLTHRISNVSCAICGALPCL